MALFTLDESAAFINTTNAAKDNTATVTSAVVTKWNEIWRQADRRVDTATGKVNQISDEIKTAVAGLRDPGEALGNLNLTPYQNTNFFAGVQLPVFASNASLGGFVDPGLPGLDTGFSINAGTVPSFGGTRPQLNLQMSLPQAPQMGSIPNELLDLAEFTPGRVGAPTGTVPGFANKTAEAALGGALTGVNLNAPANFAATTFVRQAPLSVAVQEIMAEQFAAARPAVITPVKDAALVTLESLGVYTPGYRLEQLLAPTLSGIEAKSFNETLTIRELLFNHDVPAISMPVLPTMDAVSTPAFGGYSVMQNPVGDFRTEYRLERFTPPSLDRYLQDAPEYTKHGIQFAPKSFGGFSFRYDSNQIGDAPDLDRYNFTLPDAPQLSMPTDVADVQLSSVTTALAAPDFSNAPEVGELLELELPKVPQIDWVALGQVTALDVPPAPEAPDVTTLSDFSDLVRQQESELRNSLDRILLETGGELRKLLPDFTRMREGAVKALVFGQVGEGTGNVAIKAFIDEHTVGSANLVDRLSNAAAVNLSGRGFTMPNGLLAAAQRRQNMEAMQLATQGYSAAIRQGMEIISTHMLEGAKLAVDVHKYLEEAKFRWMSLVFEKMIEALRMAMDVELRQAELEISVYNAEVEMHKSNLEVLRMYMEQDKHKLEVTRAQIEVFRSYIEAEQSKGQLNLIQAQIFETKMRAFLSRVEIFKAQVDARGQEVQMVEQELGVYRAQLDGYRAKIEAQAAKVDMYKTQVDAEASKVRLAEADTGIYRAKIDAQTAVIQAMQAEVEAFKAETDAEAAKVQMARAHTDAFRAEVEAFQARASLAEVDMKAFVIQNEVEKAKADIIRSELDVYRTKIDAENAKVEVMKAERGSYDQEVQLEITKQNINAEKLRAFASQIQLEAAKAQMLDVYGRAYEVEGRIEEAKGRVFASKVDAFKSEVDAELAKVDLAKGDVEIFRSKAELEAAKAQLVKNEADVFSSRAQVESQKLQLLEAQERLYASKVELETAKVDIYKADVDAYNSYVSSLNAKASIEQAKVDVFKAQVEADAQNVAAIRNEVDAYAQAVQADANIVSEQGNQLEAMKARGQVLSAQADVFGKQADIYQSQVQNESVKAELGKARASMVGAFADVQNAKVSAYRAEVDAETARLQGETAKIDAYRAEVDAHRSAVEAYRSTIEGQRAEVDARSQSNRAKIDAYIAQVDGQAAALKARAAAVEQEAATYNAVTQRWGLALESQGKIAELDIAKIQYANTQAIELYKANLAKLEAERTIALEEVKLRVQGVTAQAQIHSTLAAGAMASINIGANMSTTASASLGSSAGVNVSETRSYSDD